MIAHLLRQPGIRFDLAVVGVCVGLVASHVAGASLPITSAVATTIAALVMVGVPVPWRCATAATAWALLTGFVVNRYGDLTFATGDTIRLGAMVVSVVAVGAIPPAPVGTSEVLPDRVGHGNRSDP